MSSPGWVSPESSVRFRVQCSRGLGACLFGCFVRLPQRINLQVYGINKCRGEVMISSSSPGHCAAPQHREILPSSLVAFKNRGLLVSFGRRRRWYRTGRDLYNWVDPLDGNNQALRLKAPRRERGLKLLKLLIRLIFQKGNTFCQKYI